jgi:hypothetical protein
MKIWIQLQCQTNSNKSQQNGYNPTWPKTIDFEKNKVMHQIMLSTLESLKTHFELTCNVKFNEKKSKVCTIVLLADTSKQLKRQNFKLC